MKAAHHPTPTTATASASTAGDTSSKCVRHAMDTAELWLTVATHMTAGDDAGNAFEWLSDMGVAWAGALASSWRAVHTAAEGVVSAVTSTAVTAVTAVRMQRCSARAEFAAMRTHDPTDAVWRARRMATMAATAASHAAAVADNTVATALLWSACCALAQGRGRRAWEAKPRVWRPWEPKPRTRNRPGGAAAEGASSARDTKLPRGLLHLPQEYG